MASGPSNFIKTLREELLKEFYIYDAQNRRSIVYQAPTDTKHGEKCLRTEFVYIGLTNTLEKMRETEGVWDASYDI